MKIEEIEAAMICDADLPSDLLYAPPIEDYSKIAAADDAMIDQWNAICDHTESCLR
jgi:hypothetical protein